MKIQCNVCEMAEATVLCCADEAALCWSCDEKIHAANKLASKHQRVLLSTNNSRMPNCDICQETVGYFFCLEDRALLCRKCDVAIHTVNTLVSSHQRFLLTGVKVGLEPADNRAPPSSRMTQLTKDIPDSAKSPSTGQYSKPVPVQAVGAADFSSSNLPFAGGSSADTNGIQQWEFDELLGITDLNQNYNYVDDVSSKADSGKLLGDSDCYPNLRSMEVGLDGESFGQVPDASWAVPQMSSQPTASGVWWPKTHDHDPLATYAFVPDVCYSTFPQSTRSLKRRRQMQVDSGKLLGDADSCLNLRGMEVGLDGESFGPVPDASWAVP